MECLLCSLGNLLTLLDTLNEPGRAVNSFLLCAADSAALGNGCGITESQNRGGWKGPPEITDSDPPAKSRFPAAG